MYFYDDEDLNDVDSVKSDTDDNDVDDVEESEEGDSEGEGGVPEAMTGAAKQAAKKQFMKMGGQAFLKSLSAVIAPLIPWIILILLIIIIAVGIIMFFVAVPGQIVGKFKDLGNSVVKAWSAMVQGGDEVVPISEIAEVAAYVEKMGYDLKGEGFVSSYKTEYDKWETICNISQWTSKDYNPELAEYDYKALDKLLYHDSKQGVIRRNDTGEVVDINSDPILTYIISDNQCYMIKNFNVNLDDMSGGNGDFWGDFLTAVAVVAGVLVAIFVPGGILLSAALGLLTTAGVAGASYLVVTLQSNPDWGSGLISIYHEASMGRRGDYYEQMEKGSIFLDANTKKLSIQRGWSNGTKIFDVDGWSGRYGMPLEFLLSVHLATQMPDLAIDMATSFNTEVELLLHEVSGDLTAGVLKDGAVPKNDDAFVQYPVLSDLGTEERGILDAITEGFFDFLNFLSDVFLGDSIWTDQELEQLAFTERTAARAFALGVPHSLDCGCCPHIPGSRNRDTEDFDCDGAKDLFNSDGDILDADGNVDSSKRGQFTDNGEIPEDIGHVLCEQCFRRLVNIVAALKVCDDKNWETYTPYISRVSDHWFRDVYFVMNKSDYVDDDNYSRGKEFDQKVITIDEDYFYETGERWTMYEVWEEGDTIPPGFEAGDYKLYDPSDMSTPSQLSKEEVQEINEKIVNGDTSVTRLVKKPVSNNITANFEDGWTAYGKIEDPEVSSTWEQIDANENSKGELLVDDVYANENHEIKEDILIYYKEILPGNIEQVEDGQRTETNPKIKDMFLNRKYYKYDGSIKTADAIMEDRQKYDNNPKDYNTANDQRNPDLIAKVNINKDSLGAFSILENTHTLDADYIYRDFKELIVELNYFDKEDLSDKIGDVMQWPIPECGSSGWPIRQYEKGETFYGTLINSKVDLELLRKNNAEKIKSQEDPLSDEEREALEAQVSQGAQDQLDLINSENVVTNGINNTSLTGSASSALSLRPSSGIKNDVLIAGLTGSPVDIQDSDKNGAKWEITINGVTYTRYFQGGQSYSSNKFTWSGNSDATIGSHGCGPTSMINILTGYGYDYNPEDDITGLNFNATIEGLGELYEKWTDGGTSKVYRDSYEEHITEAFEAGKPVIVLVEKGHGDAAFWTSGGHFIACLGVDESGNLITADPIYNLNYERMVYPKGISGIAGCLTGLWVPDDAPNGVNKQSFVGYEPEQTVVSPVTGKVIDYGKVVRKNEETGEKEITDFIKIQAIDHYITQNKGKYVTNFCTTEDSTYDPKKYDPENKYDPKKEGYDYFYEEYKGVIDSCVLYIEGFDLTLDETLAADDLESAEVTQYEGNTVYNMTDNVKEAQALWREDAKAAAVPFFRDGEDIYIKEGTVIGKTCKDPEGFETKTETDEAGNETTKTPPGNGNYMRLILRDLEDSIMEDVESYFRIDDATNISKTQPYQAQPGDLELLANLLHHEGCEAYFATRSVFSGKPEQARDASRVVGYVVINRAILNYGGHGTTIREQILAPGQYSTANDVTEGEDDYCDKCLANAEWCLTYDCNSVTSPTSNNPMPRNVIGQSGWCWCSSDIGKFNCWWWVDTTGDGAKTESNSAGTSPYDTFYCIDSSYPAS